MKWEKDKSAPIPVYHSADGRFRIYKGKISGFWKLQDRENPKHPEPIAYSDNLIDVKDRAEEVRQVT